MKTFWICLGAVVGGMMASGVLAQEPTLAFPGAEGFGRYAQGGRGGTVIEVTNLQNSGAGSFRAAVTASGPRTVVFRVSGTIELSSRVQILNPFLTIAGHTAPGDGVTIKGSVEVRTSDVIIRYLRVRPGPGGGDVDGLLVYASPSPITRIMLDHVSVSWGRDEVLDFWSTVSNVTVQWSLISEGLPGDRPYGKGFLVGGGADNISIHHNLMAHHHVRSPYIKGGHADLVNNVAYNYGGQAHHTEGRDSTLWENAVGNYYLPGPNTLFDRGILLIGGAPHNDQSSIYLSGNIHPEARPNNSLPESQILAYHGDGLPVTTTRHDFPLITTTDAFQAFDEVLEHAGASLPVRDQVDTRIVNDVHNRTGNHITDPLQVGGWPELAGGTSPLDTDHDGMPNVWEVEKGLNPNSASDGSQDNNGDGYSNLEEYLNALALGQEGIDTDPPSPPKNLQFMQVP